MSALWRIRGSCGHCNLCGRGYSVSPGYLWRVTSRGSGALLRARAAAHLWQDRWGVHEIRALVSRSALEADPCLVGPDESEPLRLGSGETEPRDEGSGTPEPRTVGPARRSFVIEGSGVSDPEALGRARRSGMLLAPTRSTVIVITADGPRPP